MALKHPTVYPVIRQCRMRDCEVTFPAYDTLQTLCIPHALERGRQRLQKIERKAQREQREAVKRPQDLLAEAQAAFNRYIRIRDAGKSCISCDRPDDGRHQRHASHYRSVGACSNLRFNTFNVHASCARCNKYKSGNVVEYRIRLAKKIGLERVEWLEGQNNVVRYTPDYARRLKQVFTKRARLLHKRKRDG